MIVGLDLVQTRRLARSALRFDPAVVPDPGEYLFDPNDARLGAEPVDAGGRQAAWFVSGDFGSGVLRHYRRGGLVARVGRDRYVWTGARRTRSFAEFDLMHFMYRSGLPVPRPLAASYWRTGATYRAAILIERIPNVAVLAASLVPDSCGPVAAAIFAMHQAGVWHADLNAFNILLDPDYRVWLIDFDRGRRRRLGAKHRNANLLRLRRSLVKVAGERGEQYWTALNNAYQHLMSGAGSHQRAGA